MRILFFQTCYLLDTKSTSGLLVVLGTKTDLKQKKKIFQETEKYIIEKSYPLWIPVSLFKINDRT